jgi:hypothetical protein
MSTDDEQYLRSAVNEAIQNVEDHAQTRLGAAFCAKYMERSKKISVAIVDCGLGIFTTLSKRHPDILNAEMALQRVVAGEISAKSKANNLGVGISNLWAQITGALKGDVFIISENSIVYCDKLKRPKSRALGSSFGGTGVFFTVPIPDITTQKV